MRKIILIFASAIIILIIIAVSFLRSSSGFKSVYFIPEDAMIILEIQNPIDAWNHLVHSEIWKHYKSNTFLNELNTDILAYDSIINTNNLLLNIMGKKSLTMSVHHLGNNHYENLIILDVGKVANASKIEKLLDSTFGNNYELTSRKYKEERIIEILDIVNSKYYFISFSEGKLIFSFEPKLLEKAIDASRNKQIGRDMYFLSVQSKISHKGICNVFFKYKNLKPWVSALDKDAETNFYHITRYLEYGGFYFDIDENNIFTFEGYNSLNDTTPNTYLGMLSDASNNIVTNNIIPKRLASLSRIHFTNANRFVSNTMKSVGNNELESYKQSIASINKKLKINVNDNIYSWMDEEIVFLQTQPSNLGRDNEFALIIHASDSIKAAKNLSYLWKRIKKSTPVKIKTFKYHNYNIDYVAFPGIMQAFFGKTIQKLEKPYFTQINNNIIISNHPQTLKNIIDDYLTGNTLNTAQNFDDLNKEFTNKSSILFYIEPPVLFNNIKAFVDYKTWLTLNKQKEYFTCFSQVAMQLNKMDNLIQFNLKAYFKPEQTTWTPQFYNTYDITTWFTVDTTVVKLKNDTIPSIIISDLDAKKHEEYYDNGSLKLELKLNDGMKHGNFRMYHPNQQTKIKGKFEEDEPVGKWRYYNENGDLVKTDEYE